MLHGRLVLYAFNKVVTYHTSWKRGYDEKVADGSLLKYILYQAWLASETEPSNVLSGRFASRSYLPSKAQSNERK